MSSDGVRILVQTCKLPSWGMLEEVDCLRGCVQRERGRIHAVVGDSNRMDLRCWDQLPTMG